MTNQFLWIGIVVGVFITGIGIGYVVISTTQSDTPMFQNKQMQNQMMEDPEMIEIIMNEMMQDPEYMKEMINFMEENGELMHEMMKDPEFTKQMMDMIMQNEEMIEEMREMMMSKGLS